MAHRPRIDECAMAPIGTPGAGAGCVSALTARLAGALHLPH